MESSIVVLPSGRRVRLTPGRHGSPGEGVCVVELASLLAAEPFSDEPRCVDPVIASYLRAWNDRVAYVDRQRLVPFATRIVDSRLPGDVKRRRRDMCLAACGADLTGGPVRRAWTRHAMRLRIAVFVGWVEALRLDQGAGEFAARVLIGRRDLDGAFDLLERLLDLGRPPQPSANGHHPEPAKLNGNGNRPAANGAGPRSNGHAGALANGHRASPNGVGLDADAPANGVGDHDEVVEAAER